MLQEINPSYIDNLLHLTLVEMKLNRFHPQQLQEWQILELITEKEKLKVEKKVYLEQKSD